ncbi:MAG: hypothetical protein APF84_10605 [Gracilibacter sp. BRH_c7a]|nr:MAG: hypothetical protein APF84_10605 [Gracilibacter sp. BRH_c7a]
MKFNRKLPKCFFIIRVVFVTIWLQYLLAFKKILQLLAYIESKQKNIFVEQEEIEQMVTILYRIARWKFFLIRNNCLKKNLLLYYFLVQYGVKNIKINIGISKENMKLAGHCWLTIQECVYLEPEESVSKYIVIYSSGV